MSIPIPKSPENRSGRSRRRSEPRPTVTLVAVLLAATLLALPANAFGQANVEDFSETVPLGPFPVDDTCAGTGVVGILTGTETIAGQIVSTDTGRHFAGSVTFAVRIDFPDGSYIVGSGREPLTFEGTDGNATFGGTLHEQSTFYDANGTVIGHGIVNDHFRTTIVDDTFIVEIDEGRLTCR